ncbi:hypothetical protein J4214_05815 [Candidatus Woesearchaeota archaeon]|nr:hypothetical protein [Candidatus Woesearchaeota archaeon]
MMEKGKFAGKISAGVLSIFIIFIIVMNTAEARETKNSPDDLLRFDLISYTPSPVQPDDVFDLKINVKNIGNKPVNNLNIAVSDKFPFKLVSLPENNTFSKILQNEERTVTFRLKTNKNIESGAYKIYFYYVYDEYDKVTLADTFDINVENSGKTISIYEIITEPKKIIPGQPAKLIINIRNSERSTLNDIKVNLNLSSPFNLLYTTNERRVTSLENGETARIEYDIITTADAESKPYTFPLEIEYFDAEGVKFSKSNKIGLIIESPPEYEINIENSDLAVYGKRAKITFSFSNTAPSNIKFLTVNLLETDNYRIISPSEKYLGNMEPDDFETVEYDVLFRNCILFCDKKVMFPIELKFKDDFNNKHNDIRNATIQVYTNNEANNLMGKNNSNVSFVLYLLIVIFIYFAVKHYRREKDVAKSLKEAFISTLVMILMIISLLRWKNLKILPKKLKNLWVKANDK